ncbi:hypothetical protein LSAT2_004053 [Lamellibrachia satsuma]|nr:hypothetical protein LSAT2_004053 [Lamellibrachia satsuma]
MITSQVVVWIILVVLSSTLLASETWSPLQFCIYLCDYFFSKCIKKECPNRPWPVPVPQHCLDERLECIEKCLANIAEDS